MLGSVHSFDIMGGIEFVQIINSDNLHWLVISSIGCSYSHVKVYDSLYKSMPVSTKEQICNLIGSTESSITLDYVNVQAQRNGSDCGLFSVAFITALCAGTLIIIIPAIVLFKVL
jgi:Ulp1 family protease